MKFEKILVPFDGSDFSTKAVEAACALAGGRGSVTILQVYNAHVIGVVGPAGAPQVDVQVLEDAAKSEAMRIAKKGVNEAKQHGVDARGEIIESPSTVEAIVTYAESERFDVIVMGTRGNTGFKKLLLGSVSSGVVSHAMCPVLVVR